MLTNLCVYFLERKRNEKCGNFKNSISQKECCYFQRNFGYDHIKSGKDENGETGMV